MAKYLYIIKEVEDDFWKIGITDNPKTRLRNLQTGNPRKLEIVEHYTIEGLTMRFYETHLLRYLKRKGHIAPAKNDWFNISRNILFDDILGFNCDFVSRHEFTLQKV